MAGVIAGFLLSMCADGIRYYFRKKAKRKMLDDELLLLREDAVSALEQYVKNNELPSSSDASPVWVDVEASDVVLDRMFHLEAGLNIKERRNVKEIASYFPDMKFQVSLLSEAVLNRKKKIQWEDLNTGICHICCCLIYKCDQYFGTIDAAPLPALDSNSLHSKMEEVIVSIEKNLDLVIPRDR